MLFNDCTLAIRILNALNWLDAPWSIGAGFEQGWLLNSFYWLFEMAVTTEQIKNQFNRLNRGINLSIVVLILLVSLLLWKLGYTSGGEQSLWIGIALMSLALLFGKIPHICFMLMRRQAGTEGDELLKMSWPAFKDWMRQNS